MKSQRGITLISVTIYVIGITIAIAVVALLSSYFYKNIDIASKKVNPLTEFTRFSNFFSDEVNHKNIKVTQSASNFVLFSNDVQYSYVPGNKGIYRDTVKICRSVEYCNFQVKNEGGKTIVKVTIKIQGGQKKEIEYTLG